MATMNFSGAVNTATSASYLMGVALVAAGFAASTMWTDFARNNIVDVGIQGGDAIYGLAGAAVALAVLPRRYGRPLSMGMAASGGLTAAREYNLV